MSRLPRSAGERTTGKNFLVQASSRSGVLMCVFIGSFAVVSVLAFLVWQFGRRVGADKSGVNDGGGCVWIDF
jgi:hypothetical protein